MNYNLIGDDKSFKQIGTVNGYDLTINRRLSVENHTSEIGYTREIQLPTISLPIGTNWTDVGEAYMPEMEAGTWLLMLSASFQSDQDGNRAVRWYDTVNDEAIVSSEIQVPACSGATTRIQCVCTVNIPSPYKIIPQMWQNSDARLNVTTRVKYTRIA